MCTERVCGRAHKQVCSDMVRHSSMIWEQNTIILASNVFAIYYQDTSDVCINYITRIACM